MGDNKSLRFNLFGDMLRAAVVLISVLFSLRSNALGNEACSGGQGDPCRNNAQCEVPNDVATVCIDQSPRDGVSEGACQIPCQNDDGDPEPKLCSMGETCVLGAVPGGTPSYFCKPSGFAMDLNLLDTCIYHFLNGTPIFFTSSDPCSLERNMNKLLDRDGDDMFNIFDVDLCVKDFLNYNGSNGCTCPDSGDDIFLQFHDGEDCEEDSDCDDKTCEKDSECNDGEICDVETETCICIDPPCTGKFCDPDMKKCRTSCIDNSDCDNNWICDENHQCRNYCEVDAQCGDGQVCNKSTHLCACESWECSGDGVESIFCAHDEDCGSGLFCNHDLHACQRECGFIVNRASPDSSEKLERKCQGNLKTCNYGLGKCVEEPLEGHTCKLDSDCPKGAYCFVGECKPLCYTSIDCPDSNWYCSKTNKCNPMPTGGSDGETPFDPMDYNILFANRKVSLDTINDEYKIPLLMMNIKTRKQVIDEPNVVFGYRAEITYERKQAPLCNNNFNELFAEEIEACGANEDCIEGWREKQKEIAYDCIISEDEEFVTFENPFGTIYGTGDPTIDIKLNYKAVEELTPGLYVATIRVIFNNGSSDTATVSFQKKSPNGKYRGYLEIYKGHRENMLIGTNVAMDLYIHEDKDQVEWDELLADNNILAEKEYEDITRGFPVTGYMDGNASFVFNKMDSDTSESNKIPMKGIYSPGSGRMRLVSVIDIKPDHCRSEDGRDCDKKDDMQMKAQNVFDRKIRRLIEFLGTFNYKTGKYGGDPQSGYRETISGLFPANTDITLEGDFEMNIVQQEDTELEDPGKLAPIDESIGYVDRYRVLEEIEEDIETYCSLVTNPSVQTVDEYREKFETKAAYEAYVDSVEYNHADLDKGRIFERMVNFEKEIGRALDELKNNEQDYLTLSDYLKGTILFCDDQVTESCIDEEVIQCGLALYRKALLSLSPEEGEPEYVECGIDTDCPGDLICENSKCICETDRDCACHETDGCGRACEKDDECKTGMHCNFETNACECDIDNDDCQCCYEEKICNPDNRTCQSIDESWVEIYSVNPNDEFSSLTLFCPELPLQESDCAVPPKEDPALFALHEHNRFYKELVQTLSYQAGSELSEAFYVLYKAFQGDPLDQDTASKFKEIKLVKAIGNYDKIRREMYSPAATSILYQWPMKEFAGRGTSWLKYMYAATNDRLNTMVDLMDIKRRIFMDVDEDDYVFVQHLMHEEYLEQVFLYLIQSQWQKELFAYTGEAQKVLKQGTVLVNKVNMARNPLGFHPNQIYFENSDVTLNNWQNYKRRVEENLEVGKQLVDNAITNMKSAMRDRDNLEVSLMEAAHALDAQMDEICGSETPEVGDICKELSQSTNGDEFLQRSCKNTPENSDACLFEWECDNSPTTIFETNDCETVVSRYTDAVDRAEENACRVDGRNIYLMDERDNALRLCIRGKMGALIQEGILLEMQREHVTEKVQSLIRDIARETALLNETQNLSDEYLESLKNQRLALDGVADDFTLVRVVLEAEKNAARAAASMTGSGKAAWGAITGAQAGYDAALAIFEGVKRKIEIIKDYDGNMVELEKEKLATESKIHALVAEIENYVYEYELLYQQLANNEMQIQDNQWVAVRTIERYQDTLSSIVDRLIGRETGSVLLANSLIVDADAQFQKTLMEAYKMAQAFIYRYNYGDQAKEKANQVYQLMTIEEIETFTRELTQLETDYCGNSGLDCDYKNNQKIFRLSLRDTLAPDCYDQISGGNIITKGECFHNLITGSQFTKKRERASGTRKQIELPIGIFMTRGVGTSNSNGYMVNPEECNHFIVGQRNGGAAAAGTIAANIIGSRLDNNIEYELWRGDNDQVRSCTEFSNTNVPKVNQYTVGWAPQSTMADSEDPLEFLTHSQAFSACQNNWRLENPNLRNNEDSCYNYFARDRSLGTMDMRFVIPFIDDEQKWIVGDGVPKDERPVIEDVILYFRYNSQPISSD